MCIFLNFILFFIIIFFFEKKPIHLTCLTCRNDESKLSFDYVNNNQLLVEPTSEFKMNLMQL